MTHKELGLLIDNKLQSRLKELGFQILKNQVFSKLLSENKYMTLMIERTDRRTKTTWFLNPIVGFVDERVEKLSQKIASEFYSPKLIDNTLFESLGYLLPEKGYKTYDFNVSDNDKKVDKTMDTLVDHLASYATTRIGELVDDVTLFKVLSNNELGLKVTNLMKAPVLKYIMGMPDEAFNIAEENLRSIRPSQKDASLQEPNFEEVEDAFNFFKRDKDPRYYFNYLRFYERFKQLIFQHKLDS